MRLLFVILVILLLLPSCSSKLEKASPAATKKQGTQQVYLPVSQAANYEQALLLAKQNKLQQAEQILNRIAGDSVQMPWQVYANHAVLLFKLEKYAQAESEFRRAIRLNADPALYNYLALVYRQQGRFAEAEQAYLGGLKQNPRYAPIYRNLAILYEIYLFDYARARRYYLQYAQLQPVQKNQVQAWLKVMEQQTQVANQ